jgi:hypothetical protein
MLKLLQVWQYGLPTAKEETLAAAIKTAKEFGFTGLLVKALDGPDWMSNFQSSQDALGSVEEAADQRKKSAAAGLGYYIWTVPKPDQWQAQADITAELALATDGVFLDVEPYPEFWGPWRPVGLATQFMQRVRQAAPEAWIVLQPDPRKARLAEIRPDEWMAHCDAIAGQHYWSDFQVSSRDELTRAKELVEHYQKPAYPTLPGNAPLGTFPLDMLTEFAGFVVWRLGSTPAQTLTALGGVQAASPGTGIGPQCEPFIVALAHVCDSLGDELEAEANRPNVRAQEIRRILGEMRAIRAQFIGPRP